MNPPRRLHQTRGTSPSSTRLRVTRPGSRSVGTAARAGRRAAAALEARRSGSEAIRDAGSEFNTQLARQRIHVERAIRRLKTNKILHGYRPKRDTLTDTTGSTLKVKVNPEPHIAINGKHTCSSCGCERATNSRSGEPR
jgi:DDE superfamily endonuclease